MTSSAHIVYAAVVCFLIVTCLQQPINAKPSGSNQPTKDADSVNEDYADLRRVLARRLPGSTEENVKIVDLLVQLLEEIDLPTLCDVIANDTTSFVKSTNEYNGFNREGSNGKHQVSVSGDRYANKDYSFSTVRTERDQRYHQPGPETENEKANDGDEFPTMPASFPYKNMGRAIRRRVIIPRRFRPGRFNNDGSVRFPPIHRRPFSRVRPENLKKIPVPFSTIKGLGLDDSPLVNNAASSEKKRRDNRGQVTSVSGGRVDGDGGYMYRLANYVRPRSRPFSRSLILGGSQSASYNGGKEKETGKGGGEGDAEKTEEGSNIEDVERVGYGNGVDGQEIEHNLLSRFSKPRGKLVRKIIYRKRKGDKRGGSLGPIRYKIIRRIPRRFGGDAGKEMANRLNGNGESMVRLRNRYATGKGYRAPTGQSGDFGKESSDFETNNDVREFSRDGDSPDSLFLTNEVAVPRQNDVTVIDDEVYRTDRGDGFKVNEYSLDTGNAIWSEVNNDVTSSSLSYFPTTTRENKTSTQSPDITRVYEDITSSDGAKLTTEISPQTTPNKDTTIFVQSKQAGVVDYINNKNTHDVLDRVFDDNYEDIDNMIETYRSNNIDLLKDNKASKESDKYSSFEFHIGDTAETPQTSPKEKSITYDTKAFPIEPKYITNGPYETMDSVTVNTNFTSPATENTNLTSIDIISPTNDNTNVTNIHINLGSPNKHVAPNNVSSNVDGLNATNNDDTISNHSTEDDYDAYNNDPIENKSALPLFPDNRNTFKVVDNSTLKTEMGTNQDNLTSGLDPTDESIRIISVKKSSHGAGRANLVAESRVLSTDNGALREEHELEPTQLYTHVDISSTDLLDELLTPSNTTEINTKQIQGNGGERSEDTNMNKDSNIELEGRTIGDLLHVPNINESSLVDDGLGVNQVTAHNTTSETPTSRGIGNNNTLLQGTTEEESTTQIDTRNMNEIKTPVPDSKIQVNTGSDVAQHTFTNETQDNLVTTAIGMITSSDIDTDAGISNDTDTETTYVTTEPVSDIKTMATKKSSKQSNKSVSITNGSYIITNYTDELNKSDVNISPFMSRVRVTNNTKNNAQNSRQNISESQTEQEETRYTRQPTSETKTTQNETQTAHPNTNINSSITNEATERFVPTDKYPPDFEMSSGNMNSSYTAASSSFINSNVDATQIRSENISNNVQKNSTTFTTKERNKDIAPTTRHHSNSTTDVKDLNSFEDAKGGNTSMPSISNTASSETQLDRDVNPTKNISSPESVGPNISQKSADSRNSDQLDTTAQDESTRRAVLEDSTTQRIIPNTIRTKTINIDNNTLPSIENTFVHTSGRTAIPTTIPTSNSTSDQTSNPTYDQTSNPTSDQTSDPTSDQTSNPTSDQTPNPTSVPTSDQTSDPTADLTSDPASDQTSDQTSNPTSDPTSDQTSYPTPDPASDQTSDQTSDQNSDLTSSPTSNSASVPTSDPTSNPTSLINELVTKIVSIFTASDETASDSSNKTKNSIHEPERVKNETIRDKHHTSSTSRTKTIAEDDGETSISKLSKSIIVPKLNEGYESLTTEGLVSAESEDKSALHKDGANQTGKGDEGVDDNDTKFGLKNKYASQSAREMTTDENWSETEYLHDRKSNNQDEAENFQDLTPKNQRETDNSQYLTPKTQRETMTQTTIQSTNDLDDFNKRFMNWNAIRNIRKDNLKQTGIDQLSRLHDVKHPHKPKTSVYNQLGSLDQSNNDNQFSEHNSQDNNNESKHPLQPGIDNWKAYNIAIGNNKHNEFDQPQSNANLQWSELKPWTGFDPRWTNNNNNNDLDQAGFQYYDNIPSYQSLGGRPSFSSYLHPEYYRRVVNDPRVDASDRRHKQDWGNRFSQGFYGRVQDGNGYYHNDPRKQDPLRQFQKSTSVNSDSLKLKAFHQNNNYDNNNGVERENGYEGSSEVYRVDDNGSLNDVIKSPQVAISNTNPDGDFSEEYLRQIMWSHVGIDSNSESTNEKPRNHGRDYNDFSGSTNEELKRPSDFQTPIDNDVNDSMAEGDDTKGANKGVSVKPASMHLGLWPVQGLTGPLGVPAPKDYKCPGMFGYHSDPRDCQAFFICSWGVPYRLHCPPGTRFNSGQSVCDWAVNVPCPVAGSTSH